MKSLFTTFLFISLGITGCSVLSPIKNNNTKNYQLSATPYISSHKQSTRTILVLHPTSNTVYNTTQIAYTTFPYQLSYYVKNHWVDTPANMLQQLILQSLQNSHHYKAVVLPPFSGQYDYVLNTQLIELQQDFTRNPSVVRLVIRAQLVNARDNRVIAGKEFATSIEARQQTPYGGVIAANEATEILLKKLVRFCLNKS